MNPVEVAVFCGLILCFVLFAVVESMISAQRRIDREEEAERRELLRSRYPENFYPPRES